ncbi:acyl-CoA N-acyltransferase [Zopfia rhizophila CBS 207.26]|uniref:N-alpha-acetyltransferase 40 n=1 Tax=Zopfia rhizophila CBS 207.26 TaxID=1314779 RepID=A0A6A6E521_9PEZI|nr:acyl-CoA N-acyltransferase [Zopfia rhizophila CBS 207.26]
MALKRKARTKPTSSTETKPKRSLLNLKSRSKPASPTIPSSSDLVKSLNTLPFSTFAERYLPPTDPLLAPQIPSAEISITLHTSHDLSKENLRACFNLIETTSSADYKASSIGWNPREKQKEMLDKDMRYLLLRRDSSSETSTPNVSTPTSSASPPPSSLNTSTILGFLSFMLTYDDPPYADRPVLYIYEVHLSEVLRGKGVGSHLVQVAETVARRIGIEKCMLTVFNRNEGARRLYARLGYHRDGCSPPDREVRGRRIESDYVILGKMVGGSGGEGFR